MDLNNENDLINAINNYEGKAVNALLKAEEFANNAENSKENYQTELEKYFLNKQNIMANIATAFATVSLALRNRLNDLQNIIVEEGE